MLFLQSLCAPFLFTCLHSFFTCFNKLHVYIHVYDLFPANLKLNYLTYEENTIRRTIYTVLSTVFLFLSHSCGTESSPQNVLTCKLALGHVGLSTQYIPRFRAHGATQRAKERFSAKLADSGIYWFSGLVPRLEAT